jgi:hypothetical protein
LLGAFVLLAAFYSAIIPLFEGPDEDDHFRYAKFIADRRALPVQLFESGGGAAGHQGWQPPLYYALVAFIIAPIDTTDYEQHLWRNYAATFVGDPACCGRNIYYHTDSENFPFTRTTLAVHLARLLSIFFGAVTVWATYQIAIEIAATRTQSLPSQADSEPTKVGLASGLQRLQSPDLAPDLALAAASIVAFNPSFLFASALVSNDAPLAACSALVLLMWVRLLSLRASSAKQSPPCVGAGFVGNPSTPLALRSGCLLAMTKTAALLGVLIALALLTKTTALGLIPFSMLALGIVAWRQRDLRFAIVGNAVLLAIIALLAGWWFARNQILYGDPLAYRLMTTSAIFPRAGPLTLPELFQISLPWLWQTFWGGPTPGDFSVAILALLAVLTVLAAVGMVLFIIRNSKFKIPGSILMLAAWLGFILIAQIQFIRTTTGADQGRYLFPAIPAFALFFVVGLNEVIGRLARMVRLRSPQVLNFELRITNYEFVICHLLICSFFLLALFVPFAYTLPAYARPALLSENDLARAPNPLQVNFANQIELRGYDLDARSVKQGELLRVTLYWRALAPMNESYRVFVHLIGQNDRSAGGADVIPARGAFPTVYCKPGDALRDVVQIPVMPDAIPGKYEIEVGLYPVGKPGERLVVMGSGDDRAMVDRVQVAPRQSVAYSPQTPMQANFDGKAQLIGYDARTDADSVGLVLYWQSIAPFDRDYTVFVHLLDENGRNLAQADRQPQAGNYPTALWSPGEQIRDEYALPLSPTVEKYRVRVGLYRADTSERLQVQSGGRTSDYVEFDLAGAAK